jgi:Zn-dependent protease with chaperone function
MIYVFFLMIAIFYNLFKFRRNQESIYQSILQSPDTQHRLMLLGRHFHIFIFEIFLGFIVSVLISEGTFVVGLLGMGVSYLAIFGLGLFFYQYFLRYLEKTTELSLIRGFNEYIIRELRVSFSFILLPIILYSLFNWVFEADSSSTGTLLWALEIFLNIILVSVITILITVIVMLRLVPNRDVTEPEYLEIINHRLAQIGTPEMRVKWIENDINNAFVVGLRLLKFSNQTMFIGRGLRSILTLQEFDAVIAHELAHVANRHAQQRVIDLFKNFILGITGLFFFVGVIFFFGLVFLNEEIDLYQSELVFISSMVGLTWLFLNYSLYFDKLRSQEYESDAYAVFNLGADYSSLQTALIKLSSVNQNSTAFKSRSMSGGFFNRIFSLPRKYFTTHPAVEERMDSLFHKMSNGLPFDYRITQSQRLRSRFGLLFNLKFLIPSFIAFLVFSFWSITTIRQGEEMITFIRESSVEQIIGREDITSKINQRPMLFGRTLLYYIVDKQDSKLIDYYLIHGASPGRTMLYLTHTKNLGLFERYYSRLSEKLTEKEFYLILLHTANGNFVQGHRLLVNSERFEELNPSYKEDLIRPRTKRAPASNNFSND